MRSLVSYGFLAPPTVFISFCLVGALVALVWRSIRLVILIAAASLCIFIAATPAFSSFVTRMVESEVPTDGDLSRAQAIVVLGADVQSADGPIPDRLGPLSLERLLFATEAFRQLHLPVLVSGGRIGDMRTSLAGLMKMTLEEYFGVPVSWTEDQSRTTFENAFYTAQLLKGRGVDTVVVVSQARDLPRALWSFKRVGLRALPWPAPRTPLEIDQVDDFLPGPKAFLGSFYALHETIGGLYYRRAY